MSERHLAEIVEAMPDAVLLVAADGSIVYASGRIEPMLGYEPDELVGKPVERLVPKSSRRRHVGLRRSFHAGPQVRPMGLGLDLRAVRRDGAEVPVDISLGPVRLNGTTLTLCSIRDISERVVMEERLRESDARLRLAVAVGRMLPWERDLQADVVRIPGAYGSWLLGDVAGDVELSFGDFRELVHPNDRDTFDLRVASRLRGGEDEFEFRVRAADGTYHWVTSRGALLRDARGAPTRVIGVWVDTSLLKEGELALARRGRQAATIVELGELALAGMPVERLMAAASAAVARTLEVEYAKVLEFQPDDGTLVLRAGVGWHEGLVGTATVSGRRESQAGYTLLCGHPVVVRDFAMETRFVAPPLLVEHGAVSGISVVIPGTVFPMGVLGAHATVSRDFDENDVAFLQAVAHVLSEGARRIVAEEEARQALELLRRTDAERRRLLHHLVHAEEVERRRIATDIHDDSIQVMSALGLRLGLIRDHVEDRELQEMVDDLAGTVDATLTRLRQLIFELVPPALHEEGLVPALRQHLERLRMECGLEYDIEDDLTAEPDAESRGILFRIALEALANVVKHADATRIAVVLSTTDRGTHVRITDNGKGFVPAPRGDSVPGHIGLTSMRERAELAGGTFAVVSTPDLGTTVEFMVPAPDDDGGDTSSV